jgi:GT2 family glycosyltransferase
VRATAIVPFHANLRNLERSLTAVRRSLPDVELLVVADGALEDCQSIVTAAGGRLIEQAGPQGPAAARNRGAAEASGEFLCFVDSDVVVAPDALPKMCAALDAEPDLTAVFGAYDHAPDATNFMSVYKNLSHAYLHEAGRGRATTFWAGLGAVRAAAFKRAGGFDERFAKPSVEDIELGYRLFLAGQQIRLDPQIRGKHLKRWTLSSSVVTEILARGVPWTQLICKYRIPAYDLNLGLGLRLSVVLSYLFVASLALSFWSHAALWASACCLAGLVLLNARYYRWFVRERGVWFALRVIPAHLIHHLCNGVSFVAGVLLYRAARAGWKLPGALPLVARPAPSASAHNRPNPKRA